MHKGRLEAFSDGIIAILITIRVLKLKVPHGGVLWVSRPLLFWLSLVPFTTAWMTENHFTPAPVALYGVTLLMAGVGYYILSQLLIRHHGRESALA